MKNIRIVLALFVATLVINVNAQKNDKKDIKQNGPEISFTNATHDFGELNEGEIVETTFEFSNTGNEPLLISKINASCGCTVPSNWKKEAILPGETSSFTVKFNTKNKPNKQNKKIRISSNTIRNNEFVTIKANVTPNPELQKSRDERMKKWKDKKNMNMDRLGDYRRDKKSGNKLKGSSKPSINDSDIKK